MNPKAASAEKWLLRAAAVVAALVGIHAALRGGYGWLHDAEADHAKTPEIEQTLDALVDAEREREILFGPAYERQRAEVEAARQLYQRVQKGDVRIEAAE